MSTGQLWPRGGVGGGGGSDETYVTDTVVSATNVTMETANAIENTSQNPHTIADTGSGSLL